MCLVEKARSIASLPFWFTEHFIYKASVFGGQTYVKKSAVAVPTWALMLLKTRREKEEGRGRILWGERETGSCEN